MKIGYARVSTEEQSLHPQKDRLIKEGCSKVFSEKVSSGNERPELEQILRFLRPGDTLMVVKMDRIARSLKDLIRIMEEIKATGANVVFLDQAIDTTTSAGKFTFSIFAAVAEFERDLIRERTKAGLSAARARGRMGGRRPKLTDKQKQGMLTMYRQGSSAKDVGETFGVHRDYIYRLLKSDGATQHQNS